MRTLSVLALAAVLTFGGNLKADDLKDFLKEDNWEGIKEYWTIKGDTIIGKTEVDPKFNTFLCSKVKYGDFELKFQVKLTDHKGNSGVQIRSTVKDAKKFVVAGPQADIGAGWWGSLYGEQFGGMMKAADAKAVEKELKPKEFNDYSIKVEGKKCTIKVNGVVAVDQEFEKMPADGIIAFQLHAGGPMEVTFKIQEFKLLGKK